MFVDKSFFGPLNLTSEQENFLSRFWSGLVNPMICEENSLPERIVFSWCAEWFLAKTYNFDRWVLTEIEDDGEYIRVDRYFDDFGLALEALRAMVNSEKATE
jgi:hypothetical protein